MRGRPPNHTLFPTRRSSDLAPAAAQDDTRQSSEFAAPAPQGEKSKPAQEKEEEHKPTDPDTGKSTLSNEDRKSTRLNSSHTVISYAVFCLKKKTNNTLTQNK